MRIIGVDPGLSITGFGIIDVEERAKARIIDAGVIKTAQKQDVSKRLSLLSQSFLDLLERHQPCVCVLEELYSHYKHPVTAILMGHARGVICAACGMRQISLVSLPATRIKKAITGRGNASKMQMYRMVCSMLKLASAPRYYDVTDALGLALAYTQMNMSRFLEQ